MTTESSVAVLQKFNVKGIDALQVKEGLKLLKALLESNTALTNVFLGKKQQKLFNFGPLETSSFRGFILPNLDMTLELLRREGVLFQQGFHA
ncbi:hypothetical protein L3X38_014193 [Prunus dulcis]|uniref:Uncharacterized protein n=1 Tax=Prunus dulcis TaxID=3755 RepID=A0AAD4ZHQ8_PRUDU|nr:hypothetical protein L3X38_014193 [Prunus dulcis]